MSLLRKEYLRSKDRKTEILDEAAIAWVEKNIILINERLNRATISRLTNSITRFDEKFGPFSEKLPAIQDVLNKAETGLQLVLTGKTSDSRASDMLRHLSLVYSLLSDFFSGDLPTLLRTPMFKVAKENPEVRLDSISGAGWDPKVIVAAFAQALRPSKDEMKMMGRVYKNIPLPNLNVDEAANQLLGLSFKDIENLSSVGKVPMVAVPGQMKPESTPMSALSGGGATEAVVAGPPATTGVVVAQAPGTSEQATLPLPKA